MNCKFCENETGLRGSQMCDVCWNLRNNLLVLKGRYKVKAIFKILEDVLNGDFSKQIGEG